MRLVQRLRRFAASRSEARARIRTYRLIEGLPQEIRKDIGWPDSERAMRHIAERNER